MAAHKLSVFQVMPDGNLSRGLRKFEGKPEPVEGEEETSEEGATAATSAADEGLEGEANAATNNSTAAATPMETDADTAAVASSAEVEGDEAAAMDTEVSSEEKVEEAEAVGASTSDSLEGVKILEKEVEQGEVV